MSSFTTPATASGVAGVGVRMRPARPANFPAARSTGAPLMPVPPMSTPTARPGPAGISVMCGTLGPGEGALHHSARAIGGGGFPAPTPGIRVVCGFGLGVAAGEGRGHGCGHDGARRECTGGNGRQFPVLQLVTTVGRTRLRADRVDDRAGRVPAPARQGRSPRGHIVRRRARRRARSLCRFPPVRQTDRFVGRRKHELEV